MKVLVSGADGALGAAVTARLAIEGGQVASLGRSWPALDLELGQFPCGNLADERDADRVVEQAVPWLGRVDALVHLAGAFRWVETASTTLSDWRELFDANLATAIATITAALPHITEGGAIVLVGAQSAQPAGIGFGPYGAAKAGIARLAEALSAELEARRIRVNAILPAIIDTPRNRTDMPQADASRWTSPAAVADAIAFLISPASRAINGALVPVTNGA